MSAQTDADVLHRSAGEQAAAVRAGELSARELVECSLRRIEALDGELGAFVHVDAAGALAAADTIARGDPRPFAGVPIAVKDSMAVAGLPLGMGADLFAGVVADHDASFVRRLRAAGFVIVGKTALPEFGILPTTESRRLGPTRNPWDAERTPGGSSGGSAAAVAAGMVAIGTGNDGGGSIRTPAACCGLVGLKAARGRISRGPDAGDSFLVADGVLTRSVAETAAALDLLAGYEPGDASWAPDPPEPFAAAAGREPGRLRIGITTQPALASAPLDPECERAWRLAAELLEGLGHEVEEIEPAWGASDMLPLFADAFGPLIALTIAEGAALAGRAPAREDMEPLSWWLWEHASSLSAVRQLAAQASLQGLARRIVTDCAPYDAILLPALAERPPPLGVLNGVTDDPEATFARSGRFTPYTAIANVTGQPAVALPVDLGADGLPSAVQLLGRPAAEGQLLALAAQLERVAPWAGRLAPGPAARAPGTRSAG